MMTRGVKKNGDVFYELPQNIIKIEKVWNYLPFLYVWKWKMNNENVDVQWHRLKWLKKDDDIFMKHQKNSHLLNVT